MSSKLRSASEFAFLGAASGFGQSRSGVELAPDYFREHLFFNLDHVCDLGDVVSDGRIIDREAHSSNDQKAWNVAMKVFERASEAMSIGSRLVTIGGDHSVAIGSVAASLLHYPDIKVVWIDAHGDINTPLTSPSGHLHGMPLAALLGLFEHSFGGTPLKPENLFIVGVRDLDPFESKFVEQLKIKNVTASDVRRRPLQSLRKLKSWLGDNKTPVHLSFDVDALDPMVAPATGLGVADGLSAAEAQVIVRCVVRASCVRTIDIVEFNSVVTTPQQAELTLQNLALIFSEIQPRLINEKWLGLLDRTNEIAI